MNYFLKWFLIEYYEYHVTNEERSLQYYLKNSIYSKINTVYIMHTHTDDKICTNDMTFNQNVTQYVKNMYMKYNSIHNKKKIQNTSGEWYNLINTICENIQTIWLQLSVMVFFVNFRHKPQWFNSLIFMTDSN